MSTNTTFGLAQIEQIALPAQNVDRALEFYQSKLGMQYLFRADDLVFFDCAGVRLLLSPREEEDTRQGASTIYFKVSDIHEAYQALVERGVTFDDQPHFIADMGESELWMAFFRDSEQNILAISGDIPKERDS